MSNSWFKFKQFTVWQEKSAMKVCTDACLFGAWIANLIEVENYKIDNVLDIGTGTGLLALMLAQKLDAHIDAVEIDEEAASQAKENFEGSKYKERLQLIEGDIKDFQMKLPYNLIISNPPFFENDLKSQKQNRNVALHSKALSFDELILSTKKAINSDGLFAVLLPYPRAEEFIRLAEKQQFFLQTETHVKQTEKHGYFRSMLLFSSTRTTEKRSEIVIKIENEYSEDFKMLLSDYYLYL